MTLNKREFKAIQIVMDNGIQPLNHSAFLVRSQSNLEIQYRVEWSRKKWKCNCIDFEKHNKKCKHIQAVHYYLMLREISLGVKSLDDRVCPYCSSGDNVIERGWRYNKSGPVQRYYCKSCEKGFRSETVFAGIHNKAHAVVMSLDLYYRGLSLRQVESHLKSIYGIQVSHGTIYNWIKRYVEIISNYVKNQQFKTSDRWHADETYVKVHGKHLVFWALLDAETRFLLALHISKSRGERDAQAFFRKGLNVAKDMPDEIVTDGLQSYSSAIQKEFSQKQGGKNILHLQGPLSAPLNNNKVERFHRTLKQRTKTMNAIINEKTAETFAEGFEIYYNFIKQHNALDGKTPAEASGFAPGNNSWIRLISASDAYRRSR